MNKGGFSWKRLTGISGAKARMSRKTGIPFTRSGRHQKIGRSLARGGCVVPVLVVLSLAVTVKMALGARR